MKSLKNRGWVRIHRQIDDNFLWFLEPFTKAQAWVDLFLSANHKDGIIQIRGNILHIKRGQIGWSELTMAKRWTWSKNKVRRFLKLLETEQQIEQQKSPLTTVITILKYDEYQTDETADETAERQQKDNRRYTNKNDKNVKNVKNEKRERPHSKLEYLLSIPDKDIEEIQTRVVAIPVDVIRHKAVELSDYCKSKGKRYSNYRSFLKNALRKDYPKHIKTNE